MIQKEEFIFKDEIYSLLLSEHDHLLLSILNQEPFSGIYSQSVGYLATYCLENYKLRLYSLLEMEVGVAELAEEGMNEGNLEHVNVLDAVPLKYSGGIILARVFVESFGNEDVFPCYCYQNVTELIFNEGTLITTIDHSKAMVRIRKNIKKGLRDIHNKKDYRCIRKFIKESLVGNYTIILKKKRIRSQIRKIMNRIHKPSGQLPNTPNGDGEI